LPFNWDFRLTSLFGHLEYTPRECNVLDKKQVLHFQIDEGIDFNNVRKNANDLITGIIAIQ